MDELTQDEKNAAVARSRELLERIDEARDYALHALYRSIRDAAPQGPARGEARGVLTEITAVSGFTRSHVMNIRDGKVAIKEADQFPEDQAELITRALKAAQSDQ